MPASRKPKTLAEQIAELQNPGVQDFDPEDDHVFQEEAGSSADSGNEFDNDEEAGREHYEDVGKSKLRKPAAVQLGAAYRGSRISRDALQDSSEDDPFEQDYESSEDEPELNEADEEMMQDESSQQESLDETGSDMEAFEEEENDMEGMNGTGDDLSNEEDNIQHRSKKHRTNGTTDINELRKLVLEDQKAVASTLSQAMKTDVEKGKAIRAQRSAFDALLNVRIKLQPALVATNSILAASTCSPTNEALQAIEAAEVAATKLWNTVESLKASLYEDKTGQKRKRAAALEEPDLSKMWQSMQQYEADVKRQRSSNLDSWAARTRATMNAAQGRRLNDSIQQQTLTDVLNGQLSEMSRLVAKTVVPRSCAPVQAAATKKRFSEADDEAQGNMPIYDDADFYGPLLQTLVAQRSSDAAALSAMNVSFVAQPWQAMREAKTKKLVDTKASKGRKLRYTVHEKLQNIMASENRAVWSDRQCDELFASLQGRSVVLQEDDGGNEQDIAAEGLRLFAS